MSSLAQDALAVPKMDNPTDAHIAHNKRTVFGPAATTG